MIKALVEFFKRCSGGSSKNLDALQSLVNDSIADLKTKRIQLQESSDKSKALEIQLKETIEKVSQANRETEKLTAQLVSQSELTAKLEAMLRKVDAKIVEADKTVL